MLGVLSGGIFFMKWRGGGALYKLSIGDGAFKSHVMSYKSYVKLTSYERSSNRNHTHAEHQTYIIYRIDITTVKYKSC